MALKPSSNMNAKLVQQPIQAPKIKVPTIAEHTQKFEGWVQTNQGWVDLLKKLARDERGFSFTKAIEPEYRADAAYKEEWDKYAKNLSSFVAMGASFVAAVAAAPFSFTMARELMILSESLDHLPHTAGVLWLEYLDGRHAAANLNLDARREMEALRGKTGQPPRLRDYEEVLKVLYFGELERWHPEWTNNPKPARRAALFTYLTGMAPDTKPAIDNDPTLQARRDASHLTLGKVHLRRKTQAHDGPSFVRAHPGFWGLFSLAPFYRDDRGRFVADNKSGDLAWLAYATDPAGPLKVARSLITHFPNGDANSPQKDFQVYEKVPRLFTDTTRTKPGVYLHRSKAHGRDDFLVAVAGAEAQDRKCMVFCTKGVGGDKDLVPTTTAGHYDGFQKRFGNNWTNPQNAADRAQFAFAYPPADTDLGAGSWRNVGFCLQSGATEVKTAQGVVHEMEIEISSADFLHFETMYLQSRADTNGLKAITTGFVEPYLCIELSCVARNRARMPAITKGVDRGEIGYPVQVVTLSPNETSLRMYKEGDEQDYDYGNIPLEVKEWLRVYSGQELSQPITQAIDADIQAMTAYYTHFAAQDQVPLINPAMADLRPRMELAMKMLRALVSSYIVFLKFGWASDSYTGSFSGRNFNSGPRDSNEWSPASLFGVGHFAGKPRACVDLDGLLLTIAYTQPSIIDALGLGRARGADGDPFIALPAANEMTEQNSQSGIDTSGMGLMASTSSVIKNILAARMLFTNTQTMAKDLLVTVKGDLPNGTPEAINTEYAKRLYAKLQEKLQVMNHANKAWLVELFQ